MSKKILVSGIKPTGKLHFGNYFGAMKQNIDLANSGDYESYVFLADYHALTTVKNGDELRRQTLEATASYIACGLDISKAILFKQSDVREVTELTWIFNNLVTMPYMMRAHAFKDREAKDKDVNVGLFDYPVLMAADILIYGADIVPVGADQKQHVEYARDIAGYYNRAYGVEEFKLPKDYILESVATLPGIDGEKMSKSYNNHIEIFCEEEDLKKRVMSIVTDSKAPEEKKNPDENNIYNLHKLFLTADEDKELRAKFENGGYGYKEAKEELFETILKWRAGKKEKYDEIMANPESIFSILKDGGEKAKSRAEQTMKIVRSQVGLE
ncbi:TPA: tryptophan--tRNA ligase [Candidatus Nomurabacteria bacterium]|nr:tryptophan--tRNA ligase [Candidatus Nomurabacteria bacterium]